MICVWIVNDSPERAAGTLVVSRRRFGGECTGELRAPVELAPGEGRRCLDVTDLGPISLRHEFLLAEFNGLSATCLLIGERYLHLPPAKLTARAVDGLQIEIAADTFARQVALEAPGTSGAAFDDNYFDLPSGRRRIGILNSAGAQEIAVRALNAPEVRVCL